MEKAFDLNRDVLITRGGAVADDKRFSVSSHQERIEKA